MKTFLILLVSIALAAAAPSLIDTENIQPFFIGGNNASSGGVSYQVTFRTILTLHWCGGSIVNSRWVLSAAHCLDKRTASSITVMVGSNTLDGRGSFYQAQDIRIHPSYDRKTLENDIGLLQVSSAFVFTTLVQPVNLGSSYVGGGVSATFSGWGFTNQLKTRPNHLQTATVTTLTNADCKSRMTSRGEGSLVSDTKICTFTRAGQGVCSGDDGGPLVIDRFTQIGVSTWNVNPCGSGFPDGFERVSLFRTWILAQTVS